VFVLLGNVVTQ